MNIKQVLHRWRYWLPFAGILGVYLLGYGIPLMDVDATQYASIAREMLEGGRWLQVLHRGGNYLDKPPLDFWLAACSYSVFGAHDWAYRLPSLLVTLLGLYSTWRLGRLLYNHTVGYVAAMVLGSTQAWFLFQHDVRTDTLLAGWVVFASWQLIVWDRKGGWQHYLLGFAGVGMAMLAKGPIGAVVPAAALAGHWLLHGQWRRLNPLPALPGIGLVLLMLLPMSIGLYQQYGWEGPRFFFWTQSFGRITGENVWNNHPDPFFLVHSTLWAYLPWTVSLLAALAAAVAAIVKRRLPAEAYSLAGFVLPIFALSFSKFQLPHYAFVAYPFGAILTAAWLYRLWQQPPGRVWQWIIWTHRVQAVVAAAAIGFIIWVVFPLPYPVLGLLLLLPLIAIVWPWRRPAVALLLPPLATGLWLNLVLNGWFYPQLLHYQSAQPLVHTIQQQQIPVAQIVGFRWHFHSMDVYGGRNFPRLETTEELAAMRGKQPLWVCLWEQDLPLLQQAKLHYTTIATYPHRDVSRIGIKFLNPATRNQTTKNSVLVKIEADTAQ